MMHCVLPFARLASPAKWPANWMLLDVKARLNATLPVLFLVVNIHFYTYTTCIKTSLILFEACVTVSLAWTQGSTVKLH